jgi:flavin reductase (DIM6/NTAB) family NADH-FMN oxidoreductase RutF
MLAGVVEVERSCGLAAPLDVGALRAALRRVASTVHVVAVKCDDGRFFATTATAVVSVSFDPPTLLVCLNRSGVIADAILQQGVFTISTLSTRQQHVAAACAGRIEHEKRESYFECSARRRNAPLLIDAQAHFVCRRVHAAIHGTHAIVWGEAIDVTSTSAIEPLLYLNGGYGEFRPV